jgi:predicted phosphohydrolase
MDVFGNRWANYMDRLKENWEAIVGPEDTVLVPGDISWATYLQNSYGDFRFIDTLPGKKIISKGNHDYWWTTINKLNKFLDENHFDTIKFLHNNTYIYEDLCICGTRGWKCPGEDSFSGEDEKVYLRELQRLRFSLEEGKKAGKPGICVAMHYPPFNMRGEPSDFVKIMLEYNVQICIYGHLHGEAYRGAFTGSYEGIDFRLVSADYLAFAPVMLRM